MANYAYDPRPRRPRGVKILIALCVLAFLASTAGCCLVAYDYLSAANEYVALKQMVTAAAPATDGETAVPGQTETAGGETAAPTEEAAADSAAAETYIPAPVTAVDFAALKQINGDICAWLCLDDTLISYPVVQGSDNSYYIDHLYNGRYSKAGALFVDYRNSDQFTDRNTIIYGHNMRDRSMFWTLTQYKRQSYYDQHPEMRLLTPEGTYTLQLFAGCLASVDSQAWQLDFSGDDDFLAWVEQIRAASTFSSTVEVSAGDRVVTLSTCSYEFNDARYVVYGKLAAGE